MYTLEEVSKYLGATLYGDPAKVVKRISSLSDSQSDAITFLTDQRYRKLLPHTNAAAVLLSEQDQPACTVDCLVVKNPQVSTIALLELFERKGKTVSGIHDSAVISSTATVHPQASIGPNCVVGDEVVIGAGTLLHANCVIMRNCSIGTDCVIYPNVTLYQNTRCANRVILHSGAVIGADGFGNVFQDSTSGWKKIPHLAGVVLADDVEVGASTTIDRGVVSHTRIGKGVKLDNQIHIAHNVEIGEHTVLAGCVAIAGSTKIGQFCMIGGAARIINNLTVADHVRLQTGTYVLQSITEAGEYGGVITAQPVRLWRKLSVVFTRLFDLSKRVKNLERRVL